MLMLMLCYAMQCCAHANPMCCFTMLDAMLRHGMLCYAMPMPCLACAYGLLCYAKCCAMLCNAVLCSAMLCYSMLCNANANAMLCYAMLC